MRSLPLLVVACSSLAIGTTATAEERDGPIIANGAAGSWLVDGVRTQFLGITTGASFSPGASRIAVTTRTGIRLLDARGHELWRREEAFLASSPRFSRAGPSRVAFIAGNRLRVIDSDGRHETTIAAVRGVAPAWRPSGGLQQLAFVNAQGGLEVTDARGVASAHWTPPPRPLLSGCWSSDGEHLVVLTRFALTVLSATLQPQWVRRYRHAALISASCSRSGNQLALLRLRYHSPPRQAALLTTMSIASVQLPERALLTGDFFRPVWINGGARLLVGDGHRWVSVPVRGVKARRLAAPAAGVPAASAD